MVQPPLWSPTERQMVDPPLANGVSLSRLTLQGERLVPVLQVM